MSENVVDDGSTRLLLRLLLLQALMPVSVFLVGVFLGTEKYSSMYLSNVALVAVGVAVASHGEIWHPFLQCIACPLNPESTTLQAS